MTLGGWIFMLSSVGFTLWLTAYCFWKVLRKPARLPEGEHGIPPI